MKVVIYTQNNCQFTPQEKTYLTSKGVTFEERNVETNKTFLDEMMKLGSNFAGTPVTQITKDDGTTAVLKGFTQTEFDAALGGAPVAVANADMNVPAAPTNPVQTPPAPTPTPAPEPTPAPMPAPEPVQPPAPAEPPMQAANADMTMPQAPTDQPVTPPAPDPVVPTVPEPIPTPTPAPEPAPMPTTSDVVPPTQTASNPLDAILADLQQKVSAVTPATQTANADIYAKLYSTSST